MTEAAIEPYVPLEEVARDLAVSASTVRVWTRTDRIPYIRAGGVFRYKLSEVDNALRLAEKKPESDPRQLELKFDADPDHDL